jgi:enoyl-CoA hydratase
MNLENVSDQVLVEHVGPALWVTLNRPQTLNAATHVMNQDILTVLERASLDSQVRVIVLTGSGKAFCAGGDLFEHRSWVETDFEHEMQIHTKIITAMIGNRKPIICALNGAAIGWGATFALFADIVIASETATLNDPHVRIGLSAGDGGGIIWPYRMGANRASQFLLTGESIDADRAREYGLVNQVVPAGQVRQRVTELAEEIAASPEHAIRNTKATLNIPLKNLVQSAMDLSIAYEVATQRDDDYANAVRAFTERRAAKSGASGPAPVSAASVL